MTSWRDKLRPASFRGIPFEVDANEFQGGRATVTHEYPGRDEPYVEDLGKLPQSFAVEGYVVGDDFLEKRDALVDALEKEGSGTLVHPYYGTLEVSLSEPFVVRHSTSEGRVARFRMVFTRTSVPFYPETFVNGPSLSRTAGAGVNAAAADAFAASAKVEAQPEWVVTSAVNSVLEVLNYLRTLDLSQGGFAEVADFLYSVDALADAAIDVLRGGLLPHQLQDLVANVEGLFGSKKAAIDAFFGLDDYRSTQLGFSSTTGLYADGNAEAVEQLARAQALAAAASSAATNSWLSSEDAQATRDELLARIDALSVLVGDDLFSQLQALAAAVNQSVPPEAETLPHLQSVTLRASTSSLLLAWRLYGDASRDQEIVDRNHPKLPGFLAPSDPLEVLVDA